MPVFYSLISSLKIYHRILHITLWSLDLFIHVPFQLPGEHTVLQPFRRIELPCLSTRYSFSPESSEAFEGEVSCPRTHHPNNVPRLRGEKHDISLKILHQAVFETALQAATLAERNAVTIAPCPSHCCQLICNDLLTSQLIYNDLFTADSSYTMTCSLPSSPTMTCSLLTAHLQRSAHCWQLIYNDLLTADSSSTTICSLLTAHLQRSAHCWQLIYNDLLTADSSLLHGLLNYARELGMNIHDKNSSYAINLLFR